MLAKANYKNGRVRTSIAPSKLLREVSRAEKQLVISRMLSSAGFYAFVPFLFIILISRYHLSSQSASISVGALFLLARLLSTLIVPHLSSIRSDLLLVISGCICCFSTLALPLISSCFGHIALAFVFIRNVSASVQNVFYRTTAAKYGAGRGLHRIYAEMSMAMNCGSVIGPLLIVPFGQGSNTSLVAAAIFHGLSAVVLTPLLRSSMPRKIDTNTIIAEQLPQEPATRSLALYSSLYFINWFFLQQISLFLVYYCTIHLKWPPLARLYLIAQAGFVIFGTSFVTRIALTKDPVRRQVLYILGCTILPTAFLLFSAASSRMPVLATLGFALLVAVSEVIVLPLTDMVTINLGGENNSIKNFNRLSLGQAIATFGGSIVGGLVWPVFQSLNHLPWFWLTCGGIHGGILLIVLLILLVSRLIRTEQSRVVLKSCC